MSNWDVKPDVEYLVREGPVEYAIWSKANWIRNADIPHFYVMQTIEPSPRTLIVHEQAVVKPKAKEPK